jgi:hypothetical protein
MKLQVSQPEGIPRQIDLPRREVVIGREPSCDLALNDERCSRRHAVITDGPGGLTVQDTGSANGVWVNDRRLQRSRLRPGDTVRVGDTLIEILPVAAETVLATAADLRAPRQRSRPDAPTIPPEPGRTPRRRRAAESAASPTITTLTVLWALSAATCLIGSLLIALRTEAGLLAGALVVGAGLVLGAFGGIMAIGLRARAPWARQLQIVGATVGLLVCPFTFASVTILIYMLRPDVKAAFEVEFPGQATGAGDAELTFALSLLGMLALGLGLTAGVVFLLSPP